MGRRRCISHFGAGPAQLVIPVGVVCGHGDFVKVDAVGVVEEEVQRRVERLWNRMEKKDSRPERLQLEWISAAEGQKFAKVMTEIEEMRAQVTPEEILYTKEALAPQPRKAHA